MLLFEEGIDELFMRNEHLEYDAYLSFRKKNIPKFANQ